MKGRSFFNKYLPKDISFYTMEIVLSLVLVIGQPFWAVDFIKDGYWVHGIVLITNAVVGGVFLLKFSLARKLFLFYVFVGIVLLVMAGAISSLPIDEQILRKWR